LPWHSPFFRATDVIAVRGKFKQTDFPESMKWKTKDISDTTINYYCFGRVLEYPFSTGNFPPRRSMRGCDARFTNRSSMGILPRRRETDFFNDASGCAPAMPQKHFDTIQFFQSDAHICFVVGFSKHCLIFDHEVPSLEINKSESWSQ
jgi:hypothetical protein